MHLTHYYVSSVLFFTMICSCHVVSSQNTLLCYYAPTSFFPASEVPSSLCTHLVFAFGQVTVDGIAPTSTSDLKQYSILVNLKKVNPKLKVLLSLQQGFASVVDAGTTAMEKFSDNAVSFLHKHNFDGVDLDWEYPNSKQKQNYKQFIQMFSIQLKKNKLILTAALPNNPYSFKNGFDTRTMSKFLDLMTVMAYDFHLFIGGKDTLTGYNSPLNTPQGEAKFLSTKAMTEYYITAGLPRQKLLVGVPTYGRSWKLVDVGHHGLHAPATGKGDPGPIRRLRGLYLYPDVCEAVYRKAKSYLDQTNGAQYLVDINGNWVAYESTNTSNYKVSFMKEQGLAGIGIWSLHLDDVSGVCNDGRFPLTNHIKSLL